LCKINLRVGYNVIVLTNITSVFVPGFQDVHLEGMKFISLHCLYVLLFQGSWNVFIEGHVASRRR
ncbi:unnamed protein product, partial [Candidula unifasciata]